MNIQLTPGQQEQINQLLAGLFWSKPCYWKVVDNKPKRIKARGMVSDILGILPKKAKAFLASQKIEQKEMPRPVRLPRVKKEKSQRQIAEILGVDHKTVQRDLESGANAPSGSDIVYKNGANAPKPDPAKAIEREIAKKKRGPTPASHINKKRMEKIEEDIENRFSLIYRGKYVGIWDEYNGAIRQLFGSKEEALQELELMKADQIEYNDVPGWGADKARNGSDD